MVTIQEAQQIISRQSVFKEELTIQVAEGLGYFLAEAISSPMNLPAFDNSAMDGFAVCGTGQTFRLVGEIAAGDTATYTLNDGEAFRIFTGARIPQNTTAVIMQEKTEVSGDVVNVQEEIVEGKNIRRKGEEIGAGEVVFRAGQKLNPAAIGLLSSLGITGIRAFARPKVAVLTTGNELVKPGHSLKPGEIYESNGTTLQAALSHYGFSCMENRHERDDFQRISNVLAGMLHSANVVLVSGGISVGEYDFVQRALIENGVEELFYKVKQKPGKPLYFGRKEGTFVFALPGNPASSLTCFYLYVLPLLQRMAGSENPGLMKLTAPLAKAYVMKSDRPTFLKARFDGAVEILDGQSSSMLHSFAQANALAFLEGSGEFRKGEMVECYLI